MKTTQKNFNPLADVSKVGATGDKVANNSGGDLSAWGKATSKVGAVYENAAKTGGKSDTSLLSKATDKVSPVYQDAGKGKSSK